MSHGGLGEVRLLDGDGDGRWEMGDGSLDGSGGVSGWAWHLGWGWGRCWVELGMGCRLIRDMIRFIS